jgi:hypothetical protein
MTIVARTARIAAAVDQTGSQLILPALAVLGRFSRGLARPLALLGTASESTHGLIVSMSRAPRVPGADAAIGDVA